MVDVKKLSLLAVFALMSIVALRQAMACGPEMCPIKTKNAKLTLTKDKNAVSVSFHIAGTQAQIKETVDRISEMIDNVAAGKDCKCKMMQECPFGIDGLKFTKARTDQGLTVIVTSEKPDLLDLFADKLQKKLAHEETSKHCGCEGDKSKHCHCKGEKGKGCGCK